MVDLYRRDTQRLLCTGLDLTHPVDSVPEGKFPILRNVRSYQLNRAEARPGHALVSSVAALSTLHSIRRLNDDVANDFIRVVGVGTELWSGSGVLASRDTGYSGDPLALVPLRPDQSPRPWMYVADRSRMRKIRQDNTLHQIGVAPPAQAPVSELGIPRYRVIDEFDALAAWTNGGDAGAISLLNWRVNTTINRILYDHGSNIGWASVEPVAFTGIGPWLRLETNPGGGTAETVTIQEALEGSSATTISRIQYDSGTSGLCSIIPATPLSEIKRNSLLLIAATEVVRVLSVTVGPDGTQSIRASTTATRAAGDALQGLASFRAYFASNHIATEVIRSNAFRSVFTKSTNKGTLTVSALSLDLSSIIAGVPTQEEDEIHISVRVSATGNLVEGKVYLDVDSATNDFTRNYYFRAFRASDLTPITAGTETVVGQREDILKRNLIDNPFTSEHFEDLQQRINERIGFIESQVGRGVFPRPHFREDFEEKQETTSEQLDTGDTQWFELRFKVRDLTRVGTDKSRGLKNVAALRVELEISGNLTLDVDSWWLGGGYGPDLGAIGQPYLYRYRGRVSSTGAKGNFSPAARYGLEPYRQEVLLGLAGLAQSEVDRLDVERFGGQLLDWHYAGSARNFSQLTVTGATNASPIVITTSASHGLSTGDLVFIRAIVGDTAANGFWVITNVTATTFSLDGSTGNGAYTSGGTVDPSFRDRSEDLAVAINPSDGNTNFQPWPTVAQPVTGTTTAVAGTTVQDSGTNFNVSWAPGTIILIDGLPFAIYRVISTSRLELVENAGSKGIVRWEILEPVLLAQPLPALWGPMDGFVFACGDPNNPGMLYFTKGNDYDSTRETHRIEVTSPSEPLQNGAVYNSRAYVFSSERLFAIYPDFGGPNLFRVVEVPNGKGLFSRWGLAVGPKIWFGSRDGIYWTDGGEPQSLTDRDLYPLFPHEGVAGAATNGINPPDFAQTAALRLAYYKDYLYFDFIDSAGARRLLVHALDLDGWFYDAPASGLTLNRAMVSHYGEEGDGVDSLLVGWSDTTPTSYLAQVSGATDFGTAIDGQIRTRSLDQGDPRALKRYGDMLLDTDTAGGDVTAIIGFDNHGTQAGSVLVNTASRLQTVLDLSSGAGTTGRNISLNLAWTLTVTPRFYIWEPSFIGYPETTLLRATEYDDANYLGAKFYQGVVIEADTSNVARTVEVRFNDNQLGATLTVTHNGRVILPYSFAPFIGHNARLIPTDANSWRLFSWRWIWEPAPESATRWETPPLTHGLHGFHHLRDLYIAHVATANITLVVVLDGTAQAGLTITHNTGAYEKEYVRVPVYKGKSLIYRFTSAANFRLYKQDCEVRVKEWGSPGPYQLVRPFGGLSVVEGAAV